jgi:DNA-binding ferritin-like protein
VTTQPSADAATTSSGTTRQLRELLEQHRALEQQVEELAAVIDEQADRIAVLETRLQPAQLSRCRERSSPPPAPSDTDPDPESPTDSAATVSEDKDSLVDRARRFVGGDSE